MLTSDDTCSRSENEISASAVKSFYENEEHIFDRALDAVVTGCVTEYSFDTMEKKFIGFVTSIEGGHANEVKIFVNDDFAIQSAKCECPKKICYHIGALALHFGFKTPIFSCIEQGTEGIDDTSTIVNDGASKDEAYNKYETAELNDFELKKPEPFVIQMENFVNVKTTCSDKELSYIGPNQIDTKIQLRRKAKQSQQDLRTISRKKPDFPNRRLWKKRPKPLIIQAAEWLTIFDSKRNKFHIHSSHIIILKMTTQFKNITCNLKPSAPSGTFSTVKRHELRLRCRRKQCERCYVLSIGRKYGYGHKNDENFELEIWCVGILKHAHA